MREQLAEDIALARHVARKVWLGLHSVLGLELEDVEGDACLALVGARRAWEELGPVTQRNFGDRNAFLWIAVRRDLVDTLRMREGRQFKRARFRAGMVRLQLGSPQAESVPDRRLDTHAQALARVDILGYDPKRMLHSPGSGLTPRLLAPTRTADVSLRERECLWLRAHGLGLEGTAAAMGVSIDTVKTLCKKAHVRLGAKNIAHAIHLCHVRGVFEGLTEATPEGGRSEAA